MDGARVGRGIRVLRLRSGRRQQDIASAAGVSRAFVTKVEAGDLATIDLRRLQSIAQVLGASLDLRLRWRGDSLDRMLDEAHSSLVERLVPRLQRVGWECRVEQTFSIFGERGSIDVLAWHAAARIVLVVEVKSRIADVQETVGTHDRKVRLAPRIAQELDWPVAAVGRLLVVADTTTNRRRIRALGATFDTSYPWRGDAVRAWLRRPSGPMSGLLFQPYATHGAHGTPPSARTRVVLRRRPRSEVIGHPR